ncbi:uncharacterized protein LOC102300003 [Haplochromis burtoni]|uniref:uncharacterized protein LOC102300003 n=1 Tax=Haplochromis burtoni TaxID=8153 RepID=UPI001C2D32D7|nr:uncharacterized protein LOC102300003 [Haplochromis burtoni]
MIQSPPVVNSSLRNGRAHPPAFETYQHYQPLRLDGCSRLRASAEYKCLPSERTDGNGSLRECLPSRNEALIDCARSQVMRSAREPDSYEPTNKSDSKKGLFTHMKKKLPVFWKSHKTPTNYDDARLNFVYEDGCSRLRASAEYKCLPSERTDGNGSLRECLPSRNEALIDCARSQVMRSAREPDSYEPTNKSDSKKGLFTHMKKKLPVFWKSHKTPTNYDDARLNFVYEDGCSRLRASAEYKCLPSERTEYYRSLFDGNGSLRECLPSRNEALIDCGKEKSFLVFSVL